LFSNAFFDDYKDGFAVIAFTLQKYKKIGKRLDLGQKT
jgi:hypothetical protein